MAEKPTIDEVQKNADWFYGIWFSVHSSHSFDFMAQMLRSMGKWRLVYRFRYYNSGDPFDSDDEKSWYMLSAEDDSDESKQKMICTTDQMMSEIQHPPAGMEAFEPCDFLLLDAPTNSDELIKKFEEADRPWLHMKTVEKGDPDYEKYRRHHES
jgi:hypothetical protein